MTRIPIAENTASMRLLDPEQLGGADGCLNPWANIHSNAVSAGYSRTESVMVVQHISDPEAADVCHVEAAATKLSFLDRLKASWFGRFYIYHLKQYPAARSLATFLLHKAYPAYLRFGKPRLSLGRRRKASRWRSLLSLSEFVESQKLPIKKLTEPSVVETPPPRVSPPELQSYLVAPHQNYTFPATYVATLPDATVYGATHFVLTKESIVCHDLFDPPRDYTSEELHGRCAIDTARRRIRWIDYDRKPHRVPEAATFLDACAGNYAHWLTEVLPRIAELCAIPSYQHVPLVVNAGLHKNMMESLLYVIGKERVVIALPPGRAIRVGKLHVTSSVGYVPFQVRCEGERSRTHGMFSPHALELLRRKVQPALERLPANRWPEKIYLRRANGSRVITNRDEIEPLLAAHGFVAVEPEKLSFLAQAHLFSQAKEIVAPTGAAIASAIFCNPRTRLCVLMGKHEHMIYRYWANMLMPLGIEVSYILGERTDKLDLGMHADYAVDVRHLSELLSSWSAA